MQVELERGFGHGHGFLVNALDALDEEISVVNIDEGELSTIVPEARERLDAGEAAALRVAVERDGTLATDDLAARQLAAEHDVPVTGSIGLLALSVRRGTLGLETANEWLATWRSERGYYAPVERVEGVLGRDES